MRETKVIRKDATQSKNKTVNTDMLNVVITNNETGDVVLNQNVASLIFAGVIATTENGNSFTAGVAGELSSNSIFQSLEAIADVVAQALKETYELDAEDFIAIMAKISSNAVERNFSKEEGMNAVLKAIVKMNKSN